MTEPLTEAFRAFPPPPASGYHPENQMPSMLGVRPSTSMPVSSLGLLTGGLPADREVNYDPERMQRIASSMNKYAQRPVVKEFLAELKNDPDVAAALKDGASGNPMAIFAAAQNSKNLNMLMMKYATRPEFMKTMMEIANDPDLKSMTGALRGGMGIPDMPQAPARQVRPAPAPANEEYQDEEGEDELTLDPSAVSGPSAAPLSTRKKAPPPVDTE
jgi:hypothetical protein